jgi:DNA-nicking Smr family endonuclease
MGTHQAKTGKTDARRGGDEQNHRGQSSGPGAGAKQDTGNKYAHLAEPQITLDFHKAGLVTKEEVIALTERFLERCSQQKIAKALIITGKGLHSQNGQAVIKPLVQKILQRDSHVKNFSWAIRTRGGDGAFEVNLN